MSGRNGQENEIRFITSSYDELFRIPDGGTVQVTFPDRQFSERCNYIDDYHMKVGNSVYHICQYAEILEQNGGTCAPEPDILDHQSAWNIGHKDYLLIQSNDEGWDYTLYDQNFHEIDGGRLVNPWCSMLEAREEILKNHGMSGRVRIRTDYGSVETLAALEAKRNAWEQPAKENTSDKAKPGRKENAMSETTEQGTIMHDTPAEKDTLIRAMEAAGYTLDSLESTDDYLRFFGEAGQTMVMAGWQECEAWLNGVVFDDPAISDRVERTLHPERFVTEAAATNSTMRAIEDSVEQNDNQFDGIINNLPDEPPAGTANPAKLLDPGKTTRAADEAAERASVLEKLREEERVRKVRSQHVLSVRKERWLE